MAVTDRIPTDRFDDSPQGRRLDMATPVRIDTGSEAGSERGDAPESGHWTEQAMCSGKTELFFARPGERDGRRNRREALARAYCACCPVQQACLTAGRLRREHGVWGGENDEERAAAGFGPASPHRRAVAKAAREARLAAEDSMRAS